MRTDRLRAEELETLLRHLGSSRDEAAVRYEQLHHRLVTTFTHRRCVEPERLADETIDRVARRLVESPPDHREGSELVAFAYGVAWNVAREAIRSARTVPFDDRQFAAVTHSGSEELERRHLCLERCLGKLSEPERQLVVSYFEREKRAKIAHRTMIARQLGISSTALRLRIFRITSHLRPCVLRCVNDAVSIGRGRSGGS